MSSRSRTPRWWSKRPPRRNPWPDRCASSTTCSPTTTLAPRIMPPRSWSARPRRPRRPMSVTLPSPRQALRGRKPAAPPARAPNGSRFRGISMQLLNRLKLWQKLALLVAALAVPTALLGAFYLSAANGEVTQARNELGGAGYAHQVGAVLAQVANHRSLLFAVLTGDSSRRDELEQSEATIDKGISDIDATDSNVAARLGVADEWQGIKSDWQQLKSEEAKLSADDAVARHDALIGRIVKLSNLVVARSALNVDPSPQTAALIQIATRDVPGALIAAGNVQWYATRASIKGYLGGDDQMALHLYHDEVITDFGAAARDLNGAPAAARAKIVPAVESAHGAFDNSYGIIESRIINAQKMTITTAELFADSRAISASLQSLSDLGYSAMGAAVQQRLSQVTTWRNLT